MTYSRRLLRPPSEPAPLSYITGATPSVDEPTSPELLAKIQRTQEQLGQLALPDKAGLKATPLSHRKVASPLPLRPGSKEAIIAEAIAMEATKSALKELLVDALSEYPPYYPIETAKKIIRKGIADVLSRGDHHYAGFGKSERQDLITAHAGFGKSERQEKAKRQEDWITAIEKQFDVFLLKEADYTKQSLMNLKMSGTDADTDTDEVDGMPALTDTTDTDSDTDKVNDMPALEE